MYIVIFISVKSLQSGITNVVNLLQVADLEKAKTRLTQVFRAQVSSFREACYQMFGYQIDVAAEAAPVKSGKMAAASAVYTLKPQHADDDSARFQFRMTGSQQMELVRTKFVQRCLQKEVETFIDRSGLQGHTGLMLSLLLEVCLLAGALVWVCTGCRRQLLLIVRYVLQVSVHSSLHSQLHHGAVPEANPVLSSFKLHFLVINLVILLVC